MKFLFVSLGIYQIMYIALMQVIPPEFLAAFKDFPLLLVFLVLLYYIVKWVERMLKAQRVLLKEVYDIKMSQSETKQNEIIEKIETLIQKVEKLEGHIERRSGGL